MGQNYAQISAKFFKYVEETFGLNEPERFIIHLYINQTLRVFHLTVVESLMLEILEKFFYKICS